MTGPHEPSPPLTLTGSRETEALRVKMLVVLSYFALSIIFTWPLVLYWTDGMIQGYGFAVDAGQNSWNLWWTRSALVSGANPFLTRYLFYPSTVDLFWQTLGLPNAILVLPVLIAFGPFITFNTIEILSFVLSGYFVYRIAKDVIGDSIAAFLAGCIYAFAPYHMQPVLSGSLEIVATQWIPMYVYILMKALRRPGIWTVFAAGALLAITTLSSHYYGLFCAVYTAAHIGLTIVLAPDWARRRNLLLTGIGTAVAWVGLLLPFMWPLDRLNTAVLNDWYDRQIFHSAEIVDFIAPNVLHPIWGSASKEWLSAQHAFGPEAGASPGLVVYGLVIYGVIAYRRSAWAWLVLALAMTVLALGPELTIGGQSTGIPLPFKLLDYFGPFRNSSRPSRILAVMMVPLSITAAFGVLALRSRIPRHRHSVSLLLGLLLMFEFAVAPWPILQPRAEQVYLELNQDQVAGAVLEIPPLNDDARYMINQMCHGRPLVGGYLARIPLDTIPGEKSAVQQLWNAQLAPPDIIKYDLAKELAVQGIRFVTLNIPYLAEGQAAQLREVLVGAGLTSHTVNDRIEVYSVEPRLAQPVLLPEQGWHDIEFDGNRIWRWISDEAQARLISGSNTPVTISFRAAAYQVPRNLQLLLDGAVIGEYRVPETEIPISLSLLLPAGDHVLGLRSPATVAPDGRAVSMSITNLEIRSGAEPGSVQPMPVPPTIASLDGAPCR